ncbi:protein adenylyltransferase SelO [Aliihoeflea sp. 40Bstr573]|uniref:protein adenylyltransferase SelO n=1 Tax=Aliihoeflea sp. 40Bstr573 TaxID=2696467 RepID=UPI002094B4AC|nr:YdiU family protein [Aliihoeflea sp. 40Bstr573]MCO6388583.1 YdiU family protein [Aliihoeflea sp. 40Bstr573]
MPVAPTYRPSSAHASLGTEFYDPVDAARFPKHVTRFRNQDWAERLGLGDLSQDEWVAHFGSFAPLPETYAQPLALRYHGHQFRSYNPDLGDGRGFLFAQLHDDAGRLLDLATKGSGTTPWSRGGDGRLTLKGGVREVLATEMLEALGVDTSKSFSLIETGEALHRNDEPSPTRSAVLVRLSHSHIRIGTFQRLRFLDKSDDISALIDHSITHYLPEVGAQIDPGRSLAFLDAVGRRLAKTTAAWMVAGFVHGVLNTDNINITGESFDYGPWRFLPTLDPAFTAAYFDQTGLYAFGRQPDTMFWNLTRLAECLLDFAPQADLETILRAFPALVQEEFRAAFLNRLGVTSAGLEADNELVAAGWRFLAVSQLPFERFFFDWFGGQHAPRAPAGREEHSSEAFVAFRAALDPFAPRPEIDFTHAYFARPTPCTMLIDEVEDIWAPIAEADDWSRFEAKIAEIRQMGEALKLRLR